MSELDRKVLDPSINELRKIKDFEDLTVTKIKKGRKVVKLKFNFSEWVREVVLNSKPKYKTKKKYIDQRAIIKAIDYSEDIAENPPTQKFIKMFKLHKIIKHDIGKGSKKESLTEIEFDNLVNISLEKLNLQDNKVREQIEQLRGDYVLKTEVYEEQLTFDVE